MSNATTSSTTTTSNNIMDYPYQWNPGSIHPCNILKMNEIEFHEKFGLNTGLPPLYPSPIVITASSTTTTTTTTSEKQQQEDSNENNNQNENITKEKNHRKGGRNQQFQKLTQNDTILKQFPSNFHITLSSSNSFSEHRRTIPFSEYLDEVLKGPPQHPNQLSNETWYLFGETYDDEWTRLLQKYELPNFCCEACKYPDLVALSFGIGNRGSGVQWHVHGPGFSESIHGRKHWILSREKPMFHKDQTSLNWMEYTYTNITKTKKMSTTTTTEQIMKMKKKKRQMLNTEGMTRRRENDNSDDGDDDNEHLQNPTTTEYFECTLYPGDIIYFPDMWWHATINLDTYTAFVSTFTQEHKLILDDDKYDHDRDTQFNNYNDADSSSRWEL